MDLTKTHGIDLDSLYIIRLMVQTWTHRVYTWTHGLDMDSWYKNGLMVLAKTHGMDIALWY